MPLFHVCYHCSWDSNAFTKLALCGPGWDNDIIFGSLGWTFGLDMAGLLAFS